MHLLRHPKTVSAVYLSRCIFSNTHLIEKHGKAANRSPLARRAPSNLPTIQGSPFKPAAAGAKENSDVAIVVVRTRCQTVKAHRISRDIALKSHFRIDGMTSGTTQTSYMPEGCEKFWRANLANRHGHLCESCSVSV